MYDIIIVGGGPAGAALARIIGHKFRVLLLEARTFQQDMPITKQKCCGGLLDPDAQQMMAKFGLGIPKSVLLSPQLFAVRTIDITNSIERYYQRHYINIDRNEFDKWLGSILPASVDRINGCIFKYHEDTGKAVNVTYYLNGTEHQAQTKLLVGADGAFSTVRRQGFVSSPTPKLYISIQQWFESSQIDNFYGAIFDKEITDYYSWTIPKENCFILGSALKPGKDAIRKFELLKQKLKAYGYSFENTLYRNGAYLLRPVRGNQICTGNQRVALIGEAAGFISPSSAEGISYAFKSALALSKALENGIDGYEKLYRSNLKPLMRNIFFKNIKCPAMYNPHIRKLAMKSKLMSIDIDI